MLRFGNLIISQKNSHINLDIAEIYPVPILRNIFPVGKLRGFAANTANYNQLGTPCKYESNSNDMIENETEKKVVGKQVQMHAIFCAALNV